MADAGAVKLLLSLEDGQDVVKQHQILAMIGHDNTADRVDEAVRMALACLTVASHSNGRFQNEQLVPS